MSLRLWIAALLVLAAACNTPADSFPPPPVPPAQPPAPVIGHWLLEASQTGEHLQIEADGGFTEAGGSQLLSGGSLSWELSAGVWTYAAPALTLDDQQTGPHSFSVQTQRFGAVLILIEGAHSYTFDRDAATDAGADQYP